MAHSATGRIFPVELRTRPGEMAGRSCRVVTVRDITHRKKTERQLIQSQKMEAVGTLAGGIAHDFNNLLAGIQGNVELLRHRLPDQSPLQKRLGIISQIIQRGAKLSGQLLGYARGGQEQMRELDLNRLVEETIDMFGHTQRQIDLHTRLNADTPLIKGDRTQIEQVLLNLMINAVQAMPAGGDLFVETCPIELNDHENREYEIIPGSYAMLTVRDTGHGMDRETQRLVFEPFFTTKAHGEGTGLGLASTYGIVKNHKGYIEVYSETDVGTQFNVLLPKADSAETPLSIEGAEPETGTGTILVIDDEPEFLDVGRELLTMLGYTVIAATGSEAALARCVEAGGEIDIAMVDVVMPGPPVENTVRDLRKIDPTLRILLTSGYSRRSKMVQDALAVGDGFIQKPFRLVSLSRAIKAMLTASDHEN
jgi:signal transduction histidine kinase/ActR/RegA family two-component response regulator